MKHEQLKDAVQRFERLRIATTIERMAKQERKRGRLVSSDTPAKCANLVITKDFGEINRKDDK